MARCGGERPGVHRETARGAADTDARSGRQQYGFSHFALKPKWGRISGYTGKSAMNDEAAEGTLDFRDPYTLNMQVQPQDIDGLYHTNNGVYVDWCQKVAWAHSVSLGLDLERYRTLDRAMVIIRSEFDYLQPSREGEEVLLATWITEWDERITMRRAFQVIRPADGVTLLRARMNFACIEISSGKPRRMPSEFIEGYGPAVLGKTVAPDDAKDVPGAAG